MPFFTASVMALTSSCSVTSRTGIAAGAPFTNTTEYRAWFDETELSSSTGAYPSASASFSTSSYLFASTRT